MYKISSNFQCLLMLTNHKGLLLTKEIDHGT